MPEHLPTARGLDRFVTFLDAVVAIALTLLVLPLVDVANDARPDEPLGRLLRDHAGLGGSFLLSFVVIARLWRAHHRLLEHVEAYDGVLVLASLLWALTIVVLPFPTRLLAVYGSDRLADGLYIGCLLLSALCLSAVAVHVARTPALRGPGTGQYAAPVATAVALALALVVALAVPGIGKLALLLLLLSGPAARRWERRRASAARA